MASVYDVSAEAQNDLFEIWLRIAEDSVTKGSVLFFPLYSFLVAYQPGVNPIRIMAVLRGKRNVKRILKERLL